MIISVSISNVLWDLGKRGKRRGAGALIVRSCPVSTSSVCPKQERLYFELMDHVSAAQGKPHQSPPDSALQRRRRGRRQDVLSGIGLLLRLPVCMYPRVREADDGAATGWQGSATRGHCWPSWTGGLWPWTANESPFQVVLRRL